MGRGQLCYQLKCVVLRIYRYRCIEIHTHTHLGLGEGSSAKEKRAVGVCGDTKGSFMGLEG